MKALGILGGTFDPIHFGHLRMAIELYESLSLAKVHLLPCFEPVHRTPPIASPLARLAMVKAAIQQESALLADDREIRRAGPSYMIDTLLALRHEMPDTPLCLLIGMDAFLGFSHWHKYQDILKLAHLVVAHRPHHELPATGEIAELIQSHGQSSPDYLHEHLSGGILLQPVPSLEISASDIRKQIALGRNPRYLLPDNVYDYIHKHSIYS